MKKILMIIWCVCACLMFAGCSQATESGVTNSEPQIPDAHIPRPLNDAQYLDDDGGVDAKIAPRAIRPHKCILPDDCDPDQQCEHDVCVYPLPPFPDGGIWF